MDNQRLEYIDRFKGIAILLVVVGHLIQFNNIDGGTSSKLFGIIYSFHMPAFFFISGYLSHKRLSQLTSLRAVASLSYDKFIALMIPVLTWTLFVEKYAFSEYWTRIDISDIQMAILRPGLWFLQRLFEIFIINAVFAYAVHKIKSDVFRVVALTISPIVLMLGISAVVGNAQIFSLILFLVFFNFGMSVAMNATLLSMLFRNKALFSLSFLLFILLAGHWSFNGDVYDDVLKVVISVCAIIVIAQTTMHVRMPSIIDSQLQLFGRESLAIYLLQFYLTKELLALKDLSIHNAPTLFIVLIALSVPLMYFCVLVHRVISNSPMLNLLLYGKRAQLCSSHNSPS